MKGTHLPKASPSVSRRWYVRTAAVTAFAGLAGCLGGEDDPTGTASEAVDPSAPPVITSENHENPSSPVSPAGLVVYSNEEWGYRLEHPANWSLDGEGTSRLSLTSETGQLVAVVEVHTLDAHLDFQWDTESRREVLQTAREHLWAHEWTENGSNVDFELENGRQALFFDVQSPSGVREMSLWVLNERDLYQFATQAPTSVYTSQIEATIVRMFKSFCRAGAV